MCILLRSLKQNYNEFHIKNADLLSDNRLVTVREEFTGVEQRTLSFQTCISLHKKRFEKDLSDYVTYADWVTLKLNVRHNFYQCSAKVQHCSGVQIG